MSSRTVRVGLLGCGHVGSALVRLITQHGGEIETRTGVRLVVTRGARYVGMIGSRRRVATVLRHLAEEGFPIEALEAVYTPIGFDIGAETPEEIAVSIMAEIIAVRRGSPLAPRRPA